MSDCLLQQSPWLDFRDYFKNFSEVGLILYKDIVKLFVAVSFLMGYDWRRKQRSLSSK